VSLVHPSAAPCVLATVAVFVSAAAAQTHITDATVDQRLSQAEAAFGQGRPGAAERLLNEVTAWANHIRDGRRGSRDPPGDAAFAERIYQRALATFGRTFGADHSNAGDALAGLATLYAEEHRDNKAESLLHRTLAVVQRAQASPDRKQYGEGKVLRDLAKLYERQGRSTEAEAAYRGAADLFDGVGPRFVVERDEALIRCARLLRASGRPADAAALEARMLPQHRVAAARKGVEEAWGAARTVQRAGRAAEADRIPPGSHWRSRSVRRSGSRPASPTDARTLLQAGRSQGRARGCVPAARDLRPSLLVPDQLTSPYFVLGRQQPSTYTHVRLVLLPPSGLVWLATWPDALRLHARCG
jgi:tetratricopeptide (TPR) repeat protein